MKYNHKYLKKTLPLVAALILCQSSWSQYLLNGSLEGPTGQDDIPPDYWAVAESDRYYSDPDVLAQYYTPDFSNTYNPVEGSSFVLLRARGISYSEPHHNPLEREYLYQQLTNPLEKNTCFQFNAYLCTNPNYAVEDLENRNIGFPLKFQVWGSDKPAGRDTLLVDSDPISDTVWQDYSFFFSTHDTSYSYVLIEVQWDTINVKPQPYNGMILVDNLNLTKMGEANDTLNEFTLYYHGNYLDTLIASNGLSYQWSPEYAVSDPNSQSVVVQAYTETVSVHVQPGNNCPYDEIYHIILDCDTLYSQDTNRVVNHYYRYEEDIVLEASEGIEYDWEPEVNLTAYDVRAPRLTTFHDRYSVIITSEYNCIFNEYFNIILHCDTLYPDKTITVLDTLLLPGSSIQLTPWYGFLNDTWQPSRYLSCYDCQTPVATPQNSIDYSVSLKDEYECYHDEVFRIKIDLRIPNTITPNSDGYNDCLKVYGLPEGSSFKVFDKQGRLIYEKDPYNPDDCWYGFDQQGNPLKADTYWYAFDNPASGTISTGFIFIKR